MSTFSPYQILQYSSPSKAEKAALKIVRNFKNKGNEQGSLSEKDGLLYIKACQDYYKIKNDRMYGHIPYHMDPTVRMITPDESSIRTMQSPPKPVRNK